MSDEFDSLDATEKAAVHKLDRLIDEMRLLRSQMFAFDRHLRDIEASLKPSEPSEQQPESRSRPWFAAAASTTARTVLILFATGAASGAVLHYLEHDPDNGTAICALMSTRPIAIERRVQRTQLRAVILPQ